MGTSNVSFGLPGRPRLNAAFLAMAFACGMDAPIVNPLDSEMQRAFAEARLLLGYDEGARKYISLAAGAESSTAESRPAEGRPLMEQIRSAVCHGEKEEAARLMKEAVNTALPPETVIKEGLTAAMNEVGDGYGAGKVYLPQVMMAAEAMQAAFAALKELLPSMNAQSKGTAVLCTVQGDIHDLGKTSSPRCWKTAAGASSISARMSARKRSSPPSKRTARICRSLLTHDDDAP